MPSKADEASTSHKHIDKLALICYNMLRLILERKRDAMSFSIDTTQFNGMYRAPLMLRLAGKLPYATALSVLCFVLTVVLAVIGIFQLLTTIGWLLETWRLDLALPALLGLIAIIVMATLFGWLGTQLDRINTMRDELLKGKHRRYYVSSLHFSYNAIQEPLREHGAILEIALHCALLDSRVIAADELIVANPRELAGMISISRAKLTILGIIEDVMMDEGVNDLDFLTHQRQEVRRAAQHEIDKYRSHLTTARKLVDGIAG